MQAKRVWTLIALAGLAAVTVLRPDCDLDKRDGDCAASRWVRNSTEDPIVSGNPATSPVRPGVGSPWLLFRSDWSGVLWRVYQKMNENRLWPSRLGSFSLGCSRYFLTLPPLFRFTVSWPILRPSTSAFRSRQAFFPKVR